MSSFIISLCQKSASLIFRALWQAEPAKAWHGVSFVQSNPICKTTWRSAKVLSDFTRKRRQSIGWILRIQTWTQ